jgi:hypothetical protein
MQMGNDLATITPNAARAADGRQDSKVVASDTSSERVVISTFWRHIVIFLIESYPPAIKR